MKNGFHSHTQQAKWSGGPKKGGSVKISTPLKIVLTFELPIKFIIDTEQSNKPERFKIFISFSG